MNDDDPMMWRFTPTRQEPEKTPPRDITGLLAVVDRLNGLIGHVDLSPELHQPLRDERGRLLRDVGMTLDQARGAIRKRGRR
jgi:hypothetical protein